MESLTSSARFILSNSSWSISSEAESVWRVAVDEDDEGGGEEEEEEEERPDEIDPGEREIKFDEDDNDDGDEEDDADDDDSDDRDDRGDDKVDRGMDGGSGRCNEMGPKG